jgi:hypothetical protein
VKEGVPDSVERTVSENARTLSGGGSVLIWEGERRCILCARPGGGGNGYEVLPELATLGWQKWTKEGNGNGTG